MSNVIYINVKIRTETFFNPDLGVGLNFTTPVDFPLITQKW